MFGKKSSKKTPQPQEEQKTVQRPGADRLRSEGLGDVWLALTGQNPAAIMSQVVATVLTAGGTRPVWQWKHGEKEYMLLAWPEDKPIRAAVLMEGQAKENMKPVSAFPLLEGVPNDLEVAAVVPRKEGLGADIGCAMREKDNPLWFFDPLYSRDQEDLTLGVTHTFWLSGTAFGIRKALLDNVTITNGAMFDAYAADWLAKNPGKTGKDVPPLKIEVKDKHIIMPGRQFCEYQIRGVINEIEDWEFDKMPVKVLYLRFPFDDRPALNFALYASKYVLKDYVPEKGQEIEAYIWLQGRIIDLPAQETGKTA